MATTTKTKDYMGRDLVTPGTVAKDYLGRACIAGDKDYLGRALISPPSHPHGVAPASGDATGGTAVTLTGEDFTGATGVTFGGQAATAFTLVNDHTITCTTPAHAAGVVNVVVVDADGNGTLTGGFEYLPV